jgi:excisionase family DNA binding protein
MTLKQLPLMRKLAMRKRSMVNHGHGKIKQKTTMKTDKKNDRNPVLKNGSFDLPSRETIQAHLVPTPLMPEPLFYDIKQSACALNMSTKTVRRLLRRGRLTCCKVLRKILIPREQIENFLKATCDKPNLNGL